jgi:hypothetical protein
MRNPWFTIILRTSPELAPRATRNPNLAGARRDRIGHHAKHACDSEQQRGYSEKSNQV